MPTLRLSLLVGIPHVIARPSIMISISNAHPTIVIIGGHSPCHCSAFNHDLNQQCPPYDCHYWWAFPMSLIGFQS
ncbi:MAG: hypothetical protein F6J99_04560 [Moorea sp. SIO4G3]|nr:hypothetical protein [Moorena sp. SIO4G3]